MFSSLIFWIVLYLVISIGIGLYAARRVKTDNDYILAGRGLPLYIVIATTFATWFGSETVLGTSSTFLDEGISGILADPFGAGLCLILVGLFFARPLYRMGIQTLGDFYRQKYGRTVEVLASIMIIISYIGWVSAQIVALGLVFDIISEGTILTALTQTQWSFIGGGIVLIYTIFGGMWSVAMTDFFQMIIIMIGMLLVAWYVGDDAGGMTNVVSTAIADGKFSLFGTEGMTWAGIIAVLSAVLTMGFGSIPQQDVFQRVLSANSEKNSGRGAVIGGSLYIVFAFVPIMLGYAAYMVAPELLGTEDTQRILPTLILEKTPLLMQVMFFGALLSAIMSTASGTLLAPSALFAENIMKPFLPNITRPKLLLLTRLSVFGTFLIIMSFVAYKYAHNEARIFDMVESAYKITLAGAFVPLVFGIYKKKVHTINALLSMLVGVGTWISVEFFLEREMIFGLEPHFFAFLISIPAFFAGDMIAKWAGGTRNEGENMK
ncbi:MAG: sodium:solute symporter family protein [Candidatus Gracilibacteria bacterium]|nr:sodium:solute symporter family protein [Candidatus Gracilibacteria bacterium]